LTALVALLGKGENSLIYQQITCLVSDTQIVCTHKFTYTMWQKLSEGLTS